MSGSFIEELKRRNILRVATVYGVASWIILQFADVVMPATGLSEDSIAFVIAALVIGFPAVMTFCWMFEVTPEGIRPTRRVDKSESITSETGRKIDFAIIGLLSVALAFFMFEYFVGSEREVAMVEPAQAMLESQPAKPAADERPSVAVLPFVNMSSDEENEYFADGLSEELLNVLAQVPGLRVAGRTSAFFYKGKNENLTLIGEALNVENILEGSVRKSGNKVRITAQLVSAKDGFHLWSKTFDREIDDIFAIQDEISQEVSGAMQVTLLANGVTIPESATTSVAQAHDVYLRGKRALYQRTEDEVRHGMTLFKLARDLDKEYAPPLIGIADTAMILYNNHSAVDFIEAMEIAKEALDRAEELGYDNAEYWATRGLYHTHWAVYDESHLPLAEQAFQKAITLNENLVNAYSWYASTLLEDKPGDHREQARQLLQKAMELDPLNRVLNGNYQLLLSRLGRDAEAIANLERLIAVDPEYPTYRGTLAFIHALNGRTLQAVRLFADMPRDDARQGFGLLFSLILFDDDRVLDQFFSNLPVENGAFEVIQEFEFVLRRTRPELIARAQVMLLQPDYEGTGLLLAARLMQLGEYGLAKKLMENARPGYANDSPRLVYGDFGSSVDYLAVIHQLGETDRARRYAQAILEDSDWAPRGGVGSKGNSDWVPYLVLGERERAIREFELAYEAGWRAVNAQRTEQHPMFSLIEDEPRIKAVVSKIENDLAMVQEPVYAVLRDKGIIGE